jgi:hypothetical protein
MRGNSLFYSLSSCQPLFTLSASLHNNVYMMHTLCPLKMLHISFSLCYFSAYICSYVYVIGAYVHLLW